MIDESGEPSVWMDKERINLQIQISALQRQQWTMSILTCEVVMGSEYSVCKFWLRLFFLTKKLKGFILVFFVSILC